MPIISTIGRKHIKTRLLLFSIFALLTAGTLTMVYPFWLMIAGSSKSAIDTSEQKLIPSFLINRQAMWAKYVEGLFNEQLGMMQQVFETNTPSFKKVKLPAEPNKPFVDAWREFTTATPLPDYTYTLGYLQTPVSKTLPRCIRLFKKELAKRFDNKIEDLNTAFGTGFANWMAFQVRREEYLLRREIPSRFPLNLALNEFKARQPRYLRFYFSPEGFYKSFLKTRYSRDRSTTPRMERHTRRTTISTWTGTCPGGPAEPGRSVPTGKSSLDRC